MLQYLNQRGLERRNPSTFVKEWSARVLARRNSSCEVAYSTAIQASAEQETRQQESAHILIHKLDSEATECLKARADAATTKNRSR